MKDKLRAVGLNEWLDCALVWTHQRSLLTSEEATHRAPLGFEESESAAATFEVAIQLNHHLPRAVREQQVLIDSEN